MWVPRGPGAPYSDNQVSAMLMKKSPETPVAGGKRKAIAAQQKAETAESLLRVSSDLPEESSDTSQKDKANKMPRPGGEKENVADDESEEQAVVDKVLDEIGIEISGKLADAPSAHAGTIGDKSKAKSKASDDDKEIEAMLAQLKA